MGSRVVAVSWRRRRARSSFLAAWRAALAISATLIVVALPPKGNKTSLHDAVAGSFERLRRRYRMPISA